MLRTNLMAAARNPEIRRCRQVHGCHKAVVKQALVTQLHRLTALRMEIFDFDLTLKAQFRWCRQHIKICFKMNHLHTLSL